MSDPCPAVPSASSSGTSSSPGAPRDSVNQNFLVLLVKQALAAPTFSHLGAPATVLTVLREEVERRLGRELIEQQKAQFAELVSQLVSEPQILAMLPDELTCMGNALAELVDSSAWAADGPETAQGDAVRLMDLLHAVPATQELLQTSGAQELVVRLRKHENLAVKARAKQLRNHWKGVCVPAEGGGKSAKLAKALRATDVLVRRDPCTVFDRVAQGVISHINSTRASLVRGNTQANRELDTFTAQLACMEYEHDRFEADQMDLRTSSAAFAVGEMIQIEYLEHNSCSGGDEPDDSLNIRRGKKGEGDRWHRDKSWHKIELGGDFEDREPQLEGAEQCSTLMTLLGLAHCSHEEEDVTQLLRLFAAPNIYNLGMPEEPPPAVCTVADIVQAHAEGAGHSSDQLAALAARDLTIAARGAALVDQVEQIAQRDATIATLQRQLQVEGVDVESGGVFRASVASGGGGKRPAVSALAQVHCAQSTLKKVKLERDDAAEEQQDEAQYSALFIDRMHGKLDRLKALCRGAGVAETAVRDALGE